MSKWITTQLFHVWKKSESADIYQNIIKSECDLKILYQLLSTVVDV